MYCPFQTTPLSYIVLFVLFPLQLKVHALHLYICLCSESRWLLRKAQKYSHRVRLGLLLSVWLRSDRKYEHSAALKCKQIEDTTTHSPKATTWGVQVNELVNRSKINWLIVSVSFQSKKTKKKKNNLLFLLECEYKSVDAFKLWKELIWKRARNRNGARGWISIYCRSMHFINN